MKTDVRVSQTDKNKIIIIIKDNYFLANAYI